MLETMSLEHYALPIIALLVGVISLFTDRKKQTWLAGVLVVALIAACVFEIRAKNRSHREAERIQAAAEEERDEASDYRAWSMAQMDMMTSTLVAFQTDMAGRFDDLENRLRDFGYTEEALAGTNSEQAKQSLMANTERSRILATTKRMDERGSITVQYTPKGVDPGIVERALNELGFNVSTSTSTPSSAPANTIWYGQNVDTEDVELAAYTLMRAGVEIRAVKPFEKPARDNATLIQVGFDPRVGDKPALQVEQVREAARPKKTLMRTPVSDRLMLDPSRLRRNG